MFEVYTYPVELAAAVAFFILIQRLRTQLFGLTLVGRGITTHTSVT
jgi:hypothetical protein